MVTAAPGVLGALQVQTIDGIEDIIARYLLRRAGGNLNLILGAVPSKFVSTTASGPRIALNMVPLIENCLTAALTRGFVNVNIQNRIFATRFANVLFPFHTRGDVFNVIVYGEDRYATMEHANEAEAFATQLTAWCSILSNFAEARNIDVAIKGALEGSTHIRSSMSLITAGMAVGCQNREIMPYTRGFVAAGLPWGVTDSVVDVITLPYFGWLSLFMYGIASSKIESNGLFLTYQDHVAPAMPSLYPMYICFERCLMNRVRRAVFIRDPTLLETRRPEIIELCLVILSRYWSPVDPDAKRRLELLFDLADRGDREPGFPNTLAGGAHPPFRFDAAFLFSDVNAVPGAPTQPHHPYGSTVVAGVVTPTTVHKLGCHFTDVGHAEDAAGVGAVVYPAMPLSVFKTLESAKLRQVKTFYICKDPIVPACVRLVNGSTCFIYTGDAPGAGGRIDLSVLIQNRPDGRTSWSLNDLRLMADVYARDTGVPWTSIRVQDIITTFKFVEDTSRGEKIRSEDLTVSIKRHREQFFGDKFETSTLEVATHLVGDRSQLHGVSILSEERFMFPLLKFILIPVEEILKGLVHFEGVNLDTPTLYSHKVRGFSTDPLQLTRLPKLRLREGFYGTTLVGRMTFTTRAVEDYPVVDTLVKRTLPGTV